jgi:hypothetical protein
MHRRDLARTPVQTAQVPALDVVTHRQVVLYYIQSIFGFLQIGLKDVCIFITKEIFYLNSSIYN